MKKMFLGLFCFVSITTLSVSNVWAEDSANEASVEKSTVTSLTQETSATTINASTDSTALTAESEELPSLRQTLLNYVGMYGLTETLINRLSDDELDYAKKVSFHFVNQDISGTARMITKLYGEKPIPEDSYSTDYSTLTIDDLKNYLPQIRLSLIYVYDLNSDVVNNLSDQTLVDLINQVKVDYANQTIIRQLIKVLKVFLRILLIQNLHYKQLRAVQRKLLHQVQPSTKRGYFPVLAKKNQFHLPSLESSYYL